MKQFLALAAVTVAATVGTLSAGPLTYTVGSNTFYELGDGTNGLTQAYLTGSAGTNGTISPVGNVGTPGSLGAAGSFYGKSYDVRLFQMATPTNPPAANTPYATPYTGYLEQGSQTGSLGTGVVFQMISDGCTDANPTSSGVSGASQLTPVKEACPAAGSGPNNGGTDSSSNNQGTNVWMATSKGTLTVPVGVFDVSDVYTMLDNLWGQAGAVDTAITFNFSDKAGDAIGQSLTLDLTNASDNSANSAASGQIGTALECAGVGTCSHGGILYATGQLAPTSMVLATDNTTTVTVNTSTVWSTAYNNAGGVFANSSGNIVLSEQDFKVPFYALDPYLVNIQIQELNGTNFVSATTLSAVTVETAPEPSALLLMLTGIGAIGVARFRFRKS